MDEKKYRSTTERTGQQWGQYRIISSVEQGRFSRAYLGEHIQNRSKQFVIDILPVNLTWEHAQSFQQAAQRLSQLTHPHILHLVDAGVENATPFLVLDYISHVPLRQLYVRRERQPLDKLLPHIKQASGALQHAHDRGFLHKNLRPDNLLLGWNSSVLLCDFAIDVIDEDERYQSYQRSREPVDPMAYKAPEQIQRQPGKASDQYALGVMVYEWLSGMPPFQGTYLDIANQHINVPPPRLRQRAPTLAPAIEEVVMTALAKDPGKRFGSILAFINALEQAHVSTLPEQSPPACMTPPSASNVPPFTASPPSPQPPVPLPPAAPMSLPPAPMAAALPARGVPPTMQSFPAQVPATPPPVPSARSQQQKAGQATRRAFLVSAAGLAVAGGVGSWLLWQRLHPASAAQTTRNTSNTNENTNSNNQPAQTVSMVYSTHNARVNSVAWSPDGRKVASASDDKRVLVCDLSGKTLLTYNGHRDRVNAVAWSPNGKFIASGSADTTVQVWNATNGKLVFTYRRHTKGVNSVDWSADSRMIASGSDDKTVHAWFATSGSVFLFYTGHSNAVTSVAWAPDTQKIASGSWDTTVQVFSTIENDAFAVGDTIFPYKGHAAEVYAVAWSPDGTRLASAGGDNVVQVCSGVDGSSVQYPPRQHSGPVRSAGWSPDGKHLVSGSDDATVRIWNASNGQGELTFTHHSDAVLAVAWSQDGKSIASAGADKTLQVWQPKL